MEKTDPGRPTRLSSSKEAISSKNNRQSTTSPDSPHNQHSKGKSAHSPPTSQGDVSRKRSEAQSRPMDKQKTADPSPNQKRNYPKKESRDSGRKHNNVNSPNSNPNLKSRQPGVDSLQVTVNGDKQGRSVQKPSPKKMERNYAKKMERGMMMKHSNMDGGEEVRRTRPDTKNVQILHRDSRPGQEQGSTTPPQPVKGSGKKRTIDRKPLGKLVNAKLREGEDAKAPNGPTTPKKSDKQQQKEPERQTGWKVKESPSPAGEQEVQSGSDVVEPWKESMDRQEQELGKTYIFRLTKRSMKFPRALYYCRLCNYHIDTLPQCWLHIDQSRHNRLAKAKESENFFKNLPMPSPSHARALTKLLEDVTDEHVLTGREMNQRNEVRQRVENALQGHLPECKVKMYGSSLSGFGFHDSDINLDVDCPNEKQASKILVAVSQGIASRVDKDFTEFEADFEGKHPCVRFRDMESGLLCELGTGNQNAIQSSQLMVEYNECDGRLRPLVMGLRYWARMCGIDQQAIGAMPAHTFVLLVIYFLQQCEPQVLPILQKNDRFKTKNKKTIGELWVELLRFYLVGINIEEIVISIRQREPVLRADLKLPNRRIAIEDPFANGKKNVAKSLTTASVFQYIMDRFHDALKYFGIPQNGLSPDSKGQVQTSPEDSRSNDPNGNERRSEADRIAAGSTSANSEHRGSNDDDCDTAADIGAKLAEMVLNDLELEETEAVGTSEEDPQDSRSETSLNSEAISRTDKERTKDPPADVPSDTSSLPSDLDTNGAGRLDNSVTSAFINTSDTSSMNKDNESVGKADNTRKDEGETIDDDDVDYVFTFDKEILTRGEVVQLICTSCLKEGHVSKDCPEDALPPLKPLPKMDPKFLDYGTIVCEEIMLRNQPSPQDLRGREKCIAELEYYIRQHALRDARLSLFGSSGNGFGFRNSDLDICLTFQDRSTGQGVDVGFVIEKLAAALKRNHNLYNIVPIPTAKVPIVKFVHRPTRLEGDISLYNTLAQCNTRLLSMYSQIDERVRVLGYSMKFLAKHCDIGDASRGSLSSYAYTLLTIYFLQQRKPPVLPVLQELYTGDKQPVHEVDGWNAWFFDNLNQLSRVWKGRFKNTESIGSLWLGMLCFYTEEFDFTKYVVSIRQHKPLTRFEKLWMTPQRGVALEDPFDLEHNLGGAASKKMAIYIIQVLRNARELFGTPRRIPREHIMNYFLNLEALSGGEPPPNDRGCRICGKIGHFVKDCPIKRRGVERKEQEKKDRERRDRPSPKDSGTPGRNMSRDVKPTDSPNTREERNRSSESKQRSGNTANKVESPAANNSVTKDKPSSGPKEERERSKPPGKTKERSVDEVARQLYPVKPIPVKKTDDAVKKTDDAVKPEKDSKETAPSIITKKEKPAESEKKSMMQQQQQVQRNQLLHQHQHQQQQQQQDTLAALFQVMGKSPLQGGAPTQSPLIRPPTTPASAQTLDEIEQQLKSKQQQQQQTPPRLPPGAKSMEQIEQQFKQDQFFHNKDMSPSIRPQQPPQAPQPSPQQQAPPQHPLQQQSPRQQLSPQQLFPTQHGHLPPSQKVIGRPPGLGYGNREQEQEKEPQGQQRLTSQSQPIPIDPRNMQHNPQWQPLKHPGWGSPSSAFSPPSPYNRMVASPPSHQHPGYHPQMHQHPAASPPHNLLQSPPGSSTPPAMAQYFGHTPFGPSVLPANFMESRQSPGSMAVSPPHHPHQQHQQQGWPQQHPATGWHNQHEPQQRQQQHHQQQHAEPQMASAGSPRSPVESAGPMSSGVMPLEAQLQVQQAFGQSPSNRQDLAQSFHYSPLGLNPNLPRSSHIQQQPSQHHPNHPAPQHPQHGLPFQQHSDPGWQMQPHPHQQHQQHSNMQFTTTAAVGGPIMSVGQGQQSAESVMSSSSRFPPHQTMR